MINSKSKRFFPTEDEDSEEINVELAIDCNINNKESRA
jgi:hypothetical protein